VGNFYKSQFRRKTSVVILDAFFSCIITVACGKVDHLEVVCLRNSNMYVCDIYTANPFILQQKM